MSVFRNLLGSSDEYHKVKCLISSGGQYIITNYIPNENTKVEMKMNKSSWYENWDTMFGSENKFTFMQYGWDTSPITKLQVEFWGQSQPTNIDIQFNTDVVVILDATIPLFQYGNLTFTPTFGSTRPDKPLYIFAKTLNNSTSIDHYSNYKLYYFKIYENNVLVRNYMPALDENNIPCLYETISKTYLYNSGSGSFTYE